jgi:hypothetical protein
MLATVLLLLAISQRFETRGVRLGLLGDRRSFVVFSNLPNPYASTRVGRCL